MLLASRVVVHIVQGESRSVSHASRPEVSVICPAHKCLVLNVGVLERKINSLIIFVSYGKLKNYDIYQNMSV